MDSYIEKELKRREKLIINRKKEQEKRCKEFIKEREAKMAKEILNIEKNNNLVIDLLIKTNKLIQGLTTLLDFVNDPKTQEDINSSMILSADTYGKVQENLLNSISAINKEIGSKFELFKEKEAING